MDEELRYPIGRIDARAPADDERVRAARQAIRELPGQLRTALAGLDDARLDTAYRPGGWTVRQLVHHVADSHVNAYCRTRLALTEALPMLRAYDQDAWSTLADARAAPVEPSLVLLDGLHARWSLLLDELGPDDWARRLEHPVLGRLTLAQLVCHWGWHARHHLAQVERLRERLAW